MPRREHDCSRWSALFGLGVLLLQVTASAQAQISAQALLQEARRRFENLEYERALVELLSAQRLSRTQEERVSVHLLKGIVLAELSRKEEASGAFREALSLQPGAVLPLEVAPKISEQFETVRKALAVSKLESPKQLTKPEPKPEPRPEPSERSQQVPIEVQSSVQPFFYIAPEQKVEVYPHPPATLAPHAAEAHTSLGLDPHILIPAGAGGALAIAGGIFWGMARKEFTRMESDDPRLDSLPAVQGSASNGRTYQTVGFSLMGAGLVGLGLAAGLYGMDRKDSPVALRLETNGSQAVLHGRWW